MKYSIEKSGGAVVARIEGDMWGKSETSNAFKKELSTLAEGGERRFVIDFTGVSALDSTGIGIVISTLTLIQGHGGRLRLTNLNQRIKATFEITGVSKMLSIYDTVESAVERPWPK